MRATRICAPARSMPIGFRKVAPRQIAVAIAQFGLVVIERLLHAVDIDDFRCTRPFKRVARPDHHIGPAARSKAADLAAHAKRLGRRFIGDIHDIIDDRIDRISRRRVKFFDDPLYHQDNAAELLLRSGRSLPQAMTMLLPPAWENDHGLARDVRAFYEYHSGLMEPWDGPALAVFSDGLVAGAAFQRHGDAMRVLDWSQSGDAPIRPGRG